MRQVGVCVSDIENLDEGLVGRWITYARFRLDVKIVLGAHGWAGVIVAGSDSG